MKENLFIRLPNSTVYESTIRFRLSEKWSQKLKCGPPTVLSNEEEERIIVWIKEQERKGFPVTKEAVFLRVKRFLNDDQRQNPFKDNAPGEYEQNDEF